jgi:hypothetical protein
MQPLDINVERKRQQVPVAQSCLGGGATKKRVAVQPPNGYYFIDLVLYVVAIFL